MEGAVFYIFKEESLSLGRFDLKSCMEQDSMA